MAFVRVPGNPEPAGIEEIWFEGRDGLKIRAAFAPAAGAAPRGSVILCNGRTEFIEKYFEVICALQERGFAVFTMDWRGQGLSGRPLAEPMKGHIESLDHGVADLAAGLKLVAARMPRPHILIAHSMGGGISLRALQTRRVEVDGALFSAPMWGLAKVGKQAMRFARFMAAIGAGTMLIPGGTAAWKKEAFKGNVVTHDRERFGRALALVMAEPKLALGSPTLGWVVAAADGFEGFQQPGALAHLRIPIVVCSAGEEALVSNEAHEIVASLLPNAKHVTFDGAKHELMQETDDIRARFFAAFDELAALVAPQKAMA
jgi:lysophospholipase